MRLWLFRTFCEVMALPGHLCEIVALPGHLCEIVVLPGHLCEIVALPGHLCEIMALPGHHCEIVALPGHRCEIVALTGHLLAILSDTILRLQNLSKCLKQNCMAIPKRSHNYRTQTSQGTGQSLIFTNLRANLAEDEMMKFCLIFPRKIGFDISCKLSLEETLWRKSQSAVWENLRKQFSRNVKVYFLGRIIKSFQNIIC